MFFYVQLKQGSYKLSYHFDINSAIFLARHLGYTKGYWIDKIAFLVFKTKDSYAPAYNSFVPHTMRGQTFIYNTKEELNKSLQAISQLLRTERLFYFSNIAKLSAFNLRDKSSKNYSLFKSLRKMLKTKEYSDEDLLTSKKYCLKHRKIISLADGYKANEKTSDSVIKLLKSTSKPISITSADITNSPRAKSYSLPENDNINLKTINLNNQKNFLQQGLIDEFDLIIMGKGLCRCDYENHEALACGGVPMHVEGGLKFFLLRVASIFDAANPNSKAIITGKNGREYPFWKQEVREFNLENQGILKAEIARNLAGIFKGILILPVSQYLIRAEVLAIYASQMEMLVFLHELLPKLNRTLFYLINFQTQWEIIVISRM